MSYRAVKNEKFLLTPRISAIQNDVTIKYGTQSIIHCTLLSVDPTEASSDLFPWQDSACFSLYLIYSTSVCCDLWLSSVTPVTCQSSNRGHSEKCDRNFTCSSEVPCLFNMTLFLDVFSSIGMQMKIFRKPLLNWTMYCRILELKKTFEVSNQWVSQYCEWELLLIFQISDQKSYVEVKQVTNIKQCEQRLSILSWIKRCQYQFSKSLSTTFFWCWNSFLSVPDCVTTSRCREWLWTWYSQLFRAFALSLRNGTNCEFRKRRTNHWLMVIQ